MAKGVMSCVTQEVKDIYHLLEHEFFPLDLAAKVQPLLTKISKCGGKLSSAPSVPEVQLSQYVTSLENLTTLRLLQQVHFCICLDYYCFLDISFSLSAFHLVVNLLLFCFPGFPGLPDNED